MSVSVAVLLAVFGSVTLLGAVTVAVSAIEPLADVPIVPVALYTIFAAAGMFTVSFIFPEPLAVNPIAPPFCVAVNVTPVKLVGTVSWITELSFRCVGNLTSGRHIDRVVNIAAARSSKTCRIATLGSRECHTCKDAGECVNNGSACYGSRTPIGYRDRVGVLRTGGN